jgi:hypothetical protein
MSPNAGGTGGGAVSQPMSTVYTGAQINYGDLTLCLTLVKANIQRLRDVDDECTNTRIYSRVVRAFNSQSRSSNCPGFDPSILRLSGI